MIIEHYEVFKTQFDSSELNQKNWDILRTESGESAYAIEDSTKEYERNCKEAVSYEISSKYIADILKKQRCKHVVSLGVGKGILEWHLKKQMPELYIECTDYAESAIEKLKTVFVDGDDFHRFDMLKGDYQIFNKDAFFIMYRVSEEFCYSDWCKIFEGKWDKKYFVYTRYAGNRKFGNTYEEKTCKKCRAGHKGHFLWMDILRRCTRRNISDRRI